ncbi:hypothetical protein GCM10023322_48310 [Rugosimonospora acidiphila]|uniref:CoA carboxyltransferase N-terminal domain-containing protein n=1 Tax=Rugosimonospora acidiphila TaxID=556531 RepID=A0ABP9S5W2_9ACTN
MTVAIAVGRDLAPPVASDRRDPFVRLANLFDAGSVEPLYPADTSGARVVRGTIDGRRAYAYCADGARMGGAIGDDAATHIVAAIDAAVRDRAPVIGVWHSGGAKLAGGVQSFEGMGRMFVAMTRASGRVAQLSIVVGPATGAAAYGPALTDLIVTCRTDRVFATGPDVVHGVLREELDLEPPGGTVAHGRPGVVRVTTDDESEAYRLARGLVTLFSPPDGDASGEPRWS